MAVEIKDKSKCVAVLPTYKIVLGQMYRSKGDRKRRDCKISDQKRRGKGGHELCMLTLYPVWGMYTSFRCRGHEGSDSKNCPSSRFFVDVCLITSRRQECQESQLCERSQSFGIIRGVQSRHLLRMHACGKQIAECARQSIMVFMEG